MAFLYKIPKMHFNPFIIITIIVVIIIIIIIIIQTNLQTL